MYTYMYTYTCTRTVRIFDTYVVIIFLAGPVNSLLPSIQHPTTKPRTTTTICNTAISKSNNRHTNHKHRVPKIENKVLASALNWKKIATETMEEKFVALNDVVREKKIERHLSSSSFGSSGSDHKLHHEGEQDTLEYRIHASSSEGKTISLWHDISLIHHDEQTQKETEYYNFICEIPKFTRYVVFKIISFVSTCDGKIHSN
jgi:leucyl aminopeptidase